MTKRKTFVKTEWTSYEKAFFDLCQEKGWKPDREEDDTPVLLPNRSKDCYSVYAHAPGIFGCCIMATSGRTKTAVIKKLRKANIIPEDPEATVADESGKQWRHIYNEGDDEAIVLFSADRLPRAVKTLNLKRKKAHSGPSKETIEKAKAALAKYREEKKNA